MNEGGTKCGGTSIGECIIALRQQAESRLRRGVGGDALNTAVYLARLVFAHADVAAPRGFDLICISDISFASYTEPAQELLSALLAEACARGGCLASDTKLHPRSLPNRAPAERVYARMFALADIVPAWAEDLRRLFGAAGETCLLRHDANREIVLKRDRPVCRVLHTRAAADIAAQPVARMIDNTPAGDSFAAACVAARRRGEAPATAAMAGPALVGIVVGHVGAIIPRHTMTHLCVP